MYEFQDLTAAENESSQVSNIVEKIEFGDFDSKTEGFYLLSRDAPSPAEKEVVDDVPFMQGVYDFSMMLGERVFQNRLITYEFQMFNVPYRERKIFEIRLKQKLMPCGITRLKDSHEDGFYWLGKCTSVTVEDDETYQSLKAVISFDCYPFMISEKTEWDDIWDTVNFSLDIFQITHFDLLGEKEIALFNTGSVSVVLEVITTNPITIKKGNSEYSFSAGVTKDESFRIDTGRNDLVIKGYASVKFEFVKEVLG
ncbi:TPA_asm: hypothetical protein GYV56_12605 [Listeria monocytogenes]|uniref:hypothetical protein n=1 Tax=Listeria monocytogenes TaxID=1639 RepID=UPI000BE0C5EC|nr:hypothetical protein [Listeria monocytogenes]EAE4828483.1 hypothetical protein [Listeria monocytogenes]EHP7829787.1 hypothetical protein [Listeria monocytogenes]PDA36719.1 hypothetical protein A4Q59_00595 [Listeria monocytogenes]PDA49129.1 hypothetical protein A4Q53_05085 [Listeria monocytogenes]PDA71095.1 hypothetical protein A4Q45_03255 [Listeria monocytogenes]